jgi:hypothetical protein
MAINSPQGLRESARRFRTLAEEGSDAILKTSLLQLAEEFENEAATIEGVLLTEVAPGDKRVRILDRSGAALKGGRGGRSRDDSA